MNVKTWLKHTTPVQRERVLTDAGTTTDYLYQLAGGHRQPSHSLAKKLEVATRRHTPDYVMWRQELRPDIYGDVA